MPEQLTITREQLAGVVKSIVYDIDYDIAKQYDPDYEGREDPDGDTFDDLTERAWVALGNRSSEAAS